MQGNLLREIDVIALVGCQHADRRDLPVVENIEQARHHGFNSGGRQFRCLLGQAVGRQQALTQVQRYLRCSRRERRRCRCLSTLQLGPKAGDV